MPCSAAPRWLASPRLSGRRGPGHRRARLRHRNIKPVSKIVGPGNAYVAAAKRQVFGTVGVDIDRRPVGSAHHRRQICKPLLGRGGPLGAGRAWRRRAIDPRHHRRGARRFRHRGEGRWLLPRADIKRRLGAVRRHHPRAVAGRSGRARQPHGLQRDTRNAPRSHFACRFWTLVDGTMPRRREG